MSPAAVHLLHAAAEAPYHTCLSAAAHKHFQSLTSAVFDTSMQGRQSHMFTAIAAADTAAPVLKHY